MFNLRAAVVGTGFIGPVHVESLRRAGVEVIGILGSDQRKSRSAAESLGIDRPYDSIDHLLGDADVDVVHVTSPNQFHFTQVREAISAGKHVLCEKPLAIDSGESAELVRLAEKAGVAAGVNYNIRYYPLCLEMADRVRDGELGKLFHVTGSYVQDWLFHPTDFNWRVVADEGGRLRAVADIGTHWLDLLQFVTGQRVVSVFADLVTVFPERSKPIGGAETYSGKSADERESETVAVTTEDYGAVLLELESGTRGCMFVSQVTAGRKNCLRFELAGSKESAFWNSERPNDLWLGHRDTANEQLIRDPALLGDRASSASTYPGGHNEGFGDTHKQLFVDFYRCIESGQFATEPTYPTFADGHHEILLCEAVLKSHQSRSWCSIGESPS